jgi:glutamate-ammonia-ligase adenylyltransferase
MSSRRSTFPEDSAEHLADLHQQLSVELSEEDFLRGLRAYRNREYLRIGLRDLLALASLEETTRDLSFLAEAAVQAAYAYTRAQLRSAYGEAVIEVDGHTRPLGFVVFGMGKFGGLELNFSSDVDVMYLYERDGGLTTGGGKGAIEPRRFSVNWRKAHACVERFEIGGGYFGWTSACVGRSERSVVNSLPNTLVYYESWGQTWERWRCSRPVPLRRERVG